MKKVNPMLIILLLVVMAGCGDGYRQSTVIRSSDDLITVDVTRNYPKKELILQDFMDVQYIPLETTDEFLTQGDVLAVGNEVIVIRNNTREGDIFMYDKNGKGIRKINRRGQSGEEYSSIIGIVLDEDNSEIFVHESKILVYDLNGNFKRSFKYRNDYMFTRFYNYDRDHLFAFDATIEDEGFKKRLAYHVIISKQDGNIIREIAIPYKEKKATVVK